MSKRKKKRLTPEPVYCPYCNQRAAFVNGKTVREKYHGNMYFCRRCDAYVGVIDGTATPVGRMAHAAFDPLWKYGRFKGYRNAAYSWLANQMGRPMDQTHIGMMDVPECQRVVAICKDARDY